MTKEFIHAFRQLPLIVFILCCSILATSAPVCSTTAQWTDTIPALDSVAFSSADTASAVHHIWTFGDGTADSTTSTPGHKYAAAGVYQICLYVYIPNTTCADTLCQSILVGDTCAITPAWTSVRLGLDSVRFVASDTNSAATHLWRFSDGGFAYGVTSVTHGFPVPGVYTACFYVTGGAACSDSLCQTVTASTDTCGILATWSYTNTNGDTVNFAAANTDTTITAKWNFGDGTFAAGAIDTSHVYGASGFYNACLYLHKRNTGCYDTLCQSVAVGGNPCQITPAWTYYTHGGDSVRLTVADTSSAASYQWNFGDGNFATGIKDTTYRYAAPGTYHICFHVYIAGRPCSDSLCNDVTVSSDTCGLTASWSSASLGGDSLRFIAADTSTLALHTWNFGDGSPLINSMDTTHRYDSAGTFTVCLYVHLPGTDCYDTLCQAIVSGTPPCLVNPSWTSYGLGGDSVAFYASDTVSSATHVWNFGDGNLAFNTTSTDHTYDSAGTYRVCFYTYIPGTNCSDSLCQNVTIAVDTCHITSDWTSFDLGGDSVSFAAADTDRTAHHVWNFGDGSATSDTMATRHAYASSGSYHVCLYVYKTGTACSDSFCQYVNVTATSPCTITAAWTSTVVGNDSIKFTASDTNSAATHVWKFGDGTTASGTTTIVHHYAASGPYTVCFYSAIAGTGCSDSLCQTVQVTGTAACPVTAAWTSTSVGNDSISFTASDTTGAAVHLWSFGDGTTTTGTTAAIHHYASAGQYTVCFYAYIPGAGCSDTLCQTVTVTGSTPCPITASWRYSAVGTDSILFIATDTNSAAQHFWDFGDGTSASGTTDTLHPYTVRGNYNVCFYVSLPGTGCADTSCQMVPVGAPCGISAAWTYQLNGDSLNCAATDTGAASAEYLWIMNGFIVIQSKQMHLAFVAGGPYEICLDVSIPNTNCFDSICQTVYIPLGIDGSNPAPDITVMPNPFSQNAFIKVDGIVQPYCLDVYDLAGQVVRHEVSDANVFNLDRDHLASGMYVYQVTLRGIPIGQGKIIAE